MKTEKKVLQFHTGRGGSFHNSGYVTFVRFGKITDSGNFDQYFPDDNDGYTDAAGNELDFIINDDGTGYINDDGDYDSTTWVKEDDLDVKQINAIIRELDSLDGDELQRIVDEYYSEYVD